MTQQATQEWYATCKDCGEKFGYSNASYRLDARRGFSRPERCANCRRLHTREIKTLGLSHFELTPVRSIPDSGLEPGWLGGLSRPERVHELRKKTPTFDFGKFGIQDEHIREYFDIMQHHQVTVIVAPTGAGKSTFLPYRLMDPPADLPADLWTRNGQIVITQPRIQATRNIPAFVARDLYGSSLGAGFDVGFRHSGSPSTDRRNKMVYMTDGTLINMIVRNELGRLNVIMIDEAHERSLNIDLILGLLKEQLPRYPHLRLIIASATIDTARFLAYYGGPEGFGPDEYAEEVELGVTAYDNERIARALREAGSPVGFYGFPGKRRYPVEAGFRVEDPIPENQFSGRMPDEVAKKAFQILLAMETGGDDELLTMKDEAKTARGDILAFLQGAKPIERAVAAIREKVENEPRLAGKVDVLPLYTKLPQQKQDRALKPKENKDRWRVVVSTNVAETSLTVEGIVHVIDSGLINEARWDPQTQTTYVVPTTHSQAGCKQRWGRAGRVQPGVAHCLYSEAQFAAFEPHTSPEIMRSPLDQIVLTAKAAGVDDVRNFDWIQRPPEEELIRAPQTLQQLGALDKEGDLTEHGLELRFFPDDTDVANLMILADRFGCAVEMATLIPMLKLGGYTRLLRWDRSWDAPTKRAVHRIHQGLIAPCQDDVEFYLKLWEAWEGSLFGRTDNKQRRRWADQFFVNHRLFRKQIVPERESLISSLSGHKKDEWIRPVDFDLLTRVRIVMTYGLSNQIYYLSNRAAVEGEGNEAPEYKPYIADPEAHPELVKLHEDAVVEISPESICHSRLLPDYFVCGKRQRFRRRLSPLAEPVTFITAAFITLLDPEWLSVIGKHPMQVARLIADETRGPDGSLVKTTIGPRLFIDQHYPVGATFYCYSEDGQTVTVGNAAAPPPRLYASRSFEEVEEVDAVEILEAEGELAAKAGVDETGREAVEAPDETEEEPLWADMFAQDEAEEAVSHPDKREHMARGEFEGRVAYSIGEVPVNEPFLGVVTGYDFSERQEPVVQLEIPIDPDPFQEFQTRYAEGDDVTVELVGVEEYVNDWLHYLVVREAETGLEIVLDPYDVSLTGRNFAIDYLAQHLGTRIPMTVEEILPEAERVRVTRLKTAEEAMLRFMGRQSRRRVQALIADVRDNGLYLWLAPEETKNHMPCGAFAHMNYLPNRPEEMAVEETCLVDVEHKNWDRPYSRTLSGLPAELKESLAQYRWGNNLQWDEASGRLSATGRVSYEQRRRLLQLSDNGTFRRAVNIIFRRSNELWVKVLDQTGVANMYEHYVRKEPVPAEVVTVKGNGVELVTEDGYRTFVGREKVAWDRNADPRELVEVGEKTQVYVEGADLEKIEADLSLLNADEDPLNKYHAGEMASGKVTNTTHFGAFVELEPGVIGLVHISELAWGQTEKPSEVVHNGQHVKVQILEIDREKRELSLTMCLPENDPLRKYTENQRVPGTVSGFMPDGSAAFVELETGLEGYLHKDNIRAEPVGDARQVLQEGQQVLVRITRIDREERKVGLTSHGLYVDEIYIPDEYRGMVIGSRGSNIREIQQKTKTKINLDDDGYCTIEGLRQEHVQAALEQIELVLATRTVTLHIEDRQIGMLIGRGGSTIRGIQDRTGAQINVDDNTVTVTAENERALQGVLEEVRTAISYHKAIIQVPAHRVGRVIGRGGSTIKRIRQQSHVQRIDIANDNSGRITVSGDTRQQVHQAITLIRSQAGSATVLAETEGTLPPYRTVLGPETATPPQRRRRPADSSPVLSRQPVPQPREFRETPRTARQKRPAPQPRPQKYQTSLTVPVSQLPRLTRKKGRFLGLFGSGQSQKERIEKETGATILINTSTGGIRIEARSEAAVQRAARAVQATVR